ncbi:hypothetical protein NBRC116594_35250 [Shimia sp. NS0008-38b]|uniref:hypothetical protein n=1 Tax=Shimia sp. NS0008-38b TaxID=3127653 RepID=UPI00310A3C2B
MQKLDCDPKGLIFESYRIDGIVASECRSIFLDWALSLPEDQDSATAIQTLLTTYGADHPTHPMTKVLEEGQGQTQRPRRRGGWRSRKRD